MWRTGIPPLLAALLLLVGCASNPEAERKPDLGRAAVAFGGGFASAMKSGAGAVGRGTKTAWRGVREGFAEPESDSGYGPYPKRYAQLVRRYFVRVLRYPESASFVLSRPERGWMNRGLFQGGGVAWQGWLVDVEVETTMRLTGHRAGRHYVALLRDGDVVDVHLDDALLQRLSKR